MKYFVPEGMLDAKTGAVIAEARKRALDEVLAWASGKDIEYGIGVDAMRAGALSVEAWEQAREGLLHSYKEAFEEAKRSLESLITDKPLADGTWPHHVLCSGDRRFRPGTPGHNCCCHTLNLHPEPKYPPEVMEMQTIDIRGPKTQAELDILVRELQTAAFIKGCGSGRR